MSESAVRGTPLVTPLVTPLAREVAGLDACVHCGFCLTACPTYLTLEDENDSPRGRLALMRGVLDGRLDVGDPDATLHFDRCLGCRACETACPSGVPYGQLLEATRATFAAERKLPFTTRLILFVFARPRLLDLAMALARVLRATGVPALAARLRWRSVHSLAMLAATARPSRRRPVIAQESSRGTAAVLTGCVMEGLFAPVNRATEDVLAANGFALRAAPGQRCCGALHVHAGDAEGARALARENITAFERSGAEFIAVNSAGCGAAMKEYAHLLRDDPQWAGRAAAVASRVRDVSELLAIAGPAPARGPRIRAAYDAPCHLHHAQRVTTPPLDVLRAIGGVELVPLAGAEQCCGGAGIYNLTQSAIAERVLAPKLAAIDASGADVVATGNPGCMMHIGGGLARHGSRTVTRHPVEILADAYAQSAERRSGRHA